jgi:hypothetical protein
MDLVELDVESTRPTMPQTAAHETAEAHGISSPAPALVGRKEACRMFSIALRTWTEWQRVGRVPRGKWAIVPGKGGRQRLYAVGDLIRLQEDLRKRSQPYPDPDRPGCYRVPVASRLHRLEAIIDAESLPLIEGQRWNWAPGTDGGAGVVVLGIAGSPKPPMHQIIMGVRGLRFRVGHLNGDPLDCRRANLIVRSPTDQKAAARKAISKGGRPCSSRFKGVVWAREGRKWSATIATGGMTRRLGRFRSEIDAALAYDAAAYELYGQHARLNFPDPAEAHRLREAEPPIEAEAFPPPGMVDVDDACAMFDISRTAWTVWERRGRIRCGQFHAMPTGGRCKLYPVQELQRLREEFSRLGKPYPDPDRPGCYRVPLKGYLCYREALIDGASLPLVDGRNWNWTPRSDGTGGGEVILASVVGPNTPLHRLVAGVAADADTHVSHRNGDPLDCRRENLIVRTLQEQVWGNRKRGTISGHEYTSKFKGVSWCQDRGKWVVQICRDQRQRHLGRFDDEITAAQAYDAAARELFGEHARLNLPDDADVARARVVVREAKA